MNILRQIYLRYRLASSASRARVLRGRRLYGGAMKALDAIYSSFRVSPPSVEIPAKINLMYASLALELGNATLAFQCCVIVLEQLGSAKKLRSRIYSDDDILYMRYYCKLLLANMSEFSDSKPFSMALSIRETVGDLRINNVRENIRSLFPITYALGFDLDKFLEDNR